MSRIVRIIRTPKGESTGVFTIFNLEMSEEEVNKLDILKKSELFHDPEVEVLVDKLPDGDFHEVIYKNALIDPQSRTIGQGCQSFGVQLEALKVSRRYYGDAFTGVSVNPLVETVFTEEPHMETLKPRGHRVPMETYDLLVMNDKELLQLSKDLDLSLTLEQMQAIRDDQREYKLPFATDLMLDVYAILWCDHCKHTFWKALGNQLQKLRETTEEINNPNVVSAFLDNAAVWEFYEDLVIVFGAETHNSPSRKWAYGGQATKINGHERDIFMTGLGAKPIGHLEMTTVGEFRRKLYPILEKYVFSEQLLARETIAAVAKAANTMGIPMQLARMYSHPAFGAKPFAFGGTLGITTKKAGRKGLPKAGDLAVVIGLTGHDGYHGGTVASKELDITIDVGDKSHVQDSDPFSQQKMMPAIIEIRDNECADAFNDFGAGGFVSAKGEMAQPTELPWASYAGGILLNFALVPLKCAGLPDKVIAIGESQERFAIALKPEKLEIFKKICARWEIGWAVVGVFTGNGRLQIIYDENVTVFTKDTPLSGEILLDLPYKAFEDCPIPKVEVIEPPPKKNDIIFPTITTENVEDMTEKVVGHFDNCCQMAAQRQYDCTVQGTGLQGPLYGENYNVGSQLAVQTPVYGKPYGLTSSMRFCPWLLEADPVAGALNITVDAFMTHVAAGVRPIDIGLVDNFYTPNLDPCAPWYVIKQVDTIREVSKRTGPFVNGKDSNYASCEYEGQVINIPPSINVMAVGKIKDVSNLILHQWQSPGNLLYSVGRRTESLAGSTLASALEISGGKVDTIPMEVISQQVKRLANLASSQSYLSAVPINTGGLILRLFEGVEASGFGVETDLCAELFPESYGSILIEVEPENVGWIELMFGADALLVGKITDKKGIMIQGKQLNWERLFASWSTRFEMEVYNGTR